MPRAIAIMALAVLAHAATAQTVVKLDGGRCPLVDGKPFFAIGIYSTGVSDFPLLAEAGFNLVHTYGWEGKAGHEWGQEWLDAVQAHGLKALISFYRPDIKQSQFAESEKRIAMYHTHPALLAWHTMDEPGWEKETDHGEQYMPAIYQVIKRDDADHPVTAVICHFADAARFANSMDILQADYYPIPPLPAINFSGTGFAGIARYAELWREATGGQKPYWFVCQAFDYARMRQDKDIPPEWQRFPTLQELRTMTYTAVAAGARGVLYWSLSRLRSEGREGGPTADEYFARLRTVTKELQTLLPVLTAQTPETLVQQDRTVSLVKSDGQDVYVIIANMERRPTHTTLAVPGVTDAKAGPMFGEGSAPVTAGQLTLDLDSLESRVYRVPQAGAQ